MVKCVRIAPDFPRLAKRECQRFLITAASGWKILRDNVRDANAPARRSLTDEQIVFNYCSR